MRGGAWVAPWGEQNSQRKAAQKRATGRDERGAGSRPRASDVGYGLLGQPARRWGLMVLAGGKRRRHSSECRGSHALLSPCFSIPNYLSPGSLKKWVCSSRKKSLASQTSMASTTQSAWFRQTRQGRLRGMMPKNDIFT